MFLARAPERRNAALGLLFLCSIYFFQIYAHFAFTNEYTRFLLVSAVVDHGTVEIGPAMNEWGPASQDKAVFNGKYYCDKAIGTSLLGMPVYAVLKAVSGPLHIPRDPYLIIVLIRIVTITLPAVLFLIPLSRFWNEISPDDSLVPVFLFLMMFGTIVFTNSLQFISHHLEGMLLFLAFYFAYLAKQANPLRNAVISGVFSGFALITEYPAVFPVAVIWFYLVWVLPSRWKAAGSVLGALPFVLLTLYYNYLIFGTPFDVTYRHMADTGHATLHSKGFIGFGLPDPAAMWGQLFSSERGLFYYSPLLLFAIPGLILFLRDARWRREAVAFTAVILSIILFYSGMSNWDGGWCLGPRYLTPCIPFLMTGAFFLFTVERFRKSRLLGFLLAVCSVISILFVTVGTITFAFPDVGVRYPVYTVFFPFLFRGIVIPSLGTLAGMSGMSAAILFYTLLAITFIVMTAPSGSVSLPERPVWMSWARVAVCSLALVIGGAWLNPELTAFEYYARGSDYFYTGNYKYAWEDLAEAAKRGPDPKLAEMIRMRQQEVQTFARKFGTN